VIATIQAGVPVARIELLDDNTMAAVNRFSKLEYPEQPTLFLEFHGSAAGVAEQAEMVQAIAADLGASDFRWTTVAEERSKLWQARHDAYYASLALRPGSKGLTTDVCVPISRLAEAILQTKEDLRTSPLTGAIVGHVGDGNFHTIILMDPDRPEDLEEARRLSHRMVERALAMGGTCTGEHGIGSGKRKYLEAEHGPAVEIMRAIKGALDPHGIMNPGKML
jgi:D-lactate dehydrogenase (cytochrome)